MSKMTIGVLVFSLITVVGWVGFEIYHAQTVVDYPSEYTSIEAMDPYFDEEILDKIDSRRDNNLYNPFAQSE